jgi:hypothetical protein
MPAVTSGAVCARCVDRADPKTSTGLMDEWSELLAQEWTELRTRQMVNGERRELGGLVLNFVQWHTESRLRAFGMLPVGT